jgi:subtilisin family serine protease
VQPAGRYDDDIAVAQMFAGLAEKDALQGLAQPAQTGLTLGEGIVNAYASGVYTYREPPKRPARQTFDGMARWDGTSFATPLVAGLIADEISRNGSSAPEAAQAVLARAQDQAISGVGPALTAS